MNCIQLVHNKKLGLPPEKRLLEIPEQILKEASCDYFISFRNYPSCFSAAKIHSVDASKRFINTYKGNIICYYLETDSPIAPLIFWDLAHTLNIGDSLIVYDLNQGFYLERDYYRDSFKIDSKGKHCKVFTKINLLAAEKNTGLDDWTFGIPTGPGDATLLNAVVKRILEFPCKEKEIILCGRPGSNFQFWDQVRIVGEDIPAPPVQIARKKNCIAEHARYNNLCILHDRVFLPANFMEAIERFGDIYPVTTLQSIYFDDKNNMIPFRYSDYNEILKDPLAGGRAVVGTNKQNIFSAFRNNLFPFLEKEVKFIYSNPLFYKPKSYATGSLYIVKRNVIKAFPLASRLCWEEFEDVEWGIRISSAGIPSRINPYAMTQSLSMRPLVLYENSVRYLSYDQTQKRWHPLGSNLPLKRKPLFKVKQLEAWDKFMLFKEKYCPKMNVNAQELTGLSRMELITRLIAQSEFELSYENTKKFLGDVERLLFLSTISYESKEYLYHALMQRGSIAKYDLMYHAEIYNQYLDRPKKGLFPVSISEFFVKKSITNQIGSVLSASKLARQNGKAFYHPDGFNGFLKAIKYSTPYINYFLESDDERNNCK